MGRITKDRGKDLMSADEVADAAGISQETVRRLIKQGRLKTIQTEKRTYISRPEYERWLRGEGKMDGFDSESDRRDAIRKQVVDSCVVAIYERIATFGVTQTPEERKLLEIDVILALLKGCQLEAMRLMFRQEIVTAEQEIDNGK